MGFNVITQRPVGFVPIFFLENKNKSANCLLYFHGNGDDVFSSYPLLSHLHASLNVTIHPPPNKILFETLNCFAVQMHVIAVEYPGYGCHSRGSNSCNAETILSDADRVFEFMINDLKISPANIVLMGRSLGTGPASYLASQHKVGGLVLISGFTSIRGVVSDLAGVLKFLVKERFNNLERMEKVHSPTFFLHGKKDILISHN